MGRFGLGQVFGPSIWVAAQFRVLLLHSQPEPSAPQGFGGWADRLSEAVAARATHLHKLGVSTTKFLNLIDTVCCVWAELPAAVVGAGHNEDASFSPIVPASAEPPRERRG